MMAPVGAISAHMTLGLNCILGPNQHFQFYSERRSEMTSAGNLQPTKAVIFSFSVLFKRCRPFRSVRFFIWLSVAVGLLLCATSFYNHPRPANLGQSRERDSDHLVEPVSRTMITSIEAIDCFRLECSLWLGNFPDTNSDRFLSGFSFRRVRIVPTTEAPDRFEYKYSLAGQCLKCFPLQ